MKTKIIFSSILLSLVLILSACSPAKPEAPVRTINVTGSALVSLTPDIAYINIGVHSEDANAAEAVAQNNAQAEAIAQALRAKGVEGKDIRTSNFSIYPQDEYSPEGKKIGTRYVVDNIVYVTLRDLNKIGEVIGAAVDAGANSIQGIQFDVADKTPLLAEGRKAAVENARLQAEELAKAAGVELGAVQSINYYSSAPTPIYADVKSLGMGGGAAMSVPISPGQLTLSVDVNIVYEIR